MGTEKLDEIEARAAAATEGPWTADGCGEGCCNSITSPGTDLDEPVAGVDTPETTVPARTSRGWLRRCGGCTMPSPPSQGQRPGRIMTRTQRTVPTLLALIVLSSPVWVALLIGGRP